MSANNKSKIKTETYVGKCPVYIETEADVHVLHKYTLYNYGSMTGKHSTALSNNFQKLNSG